MTAMAHSAPRHLVSRSVAALGEQVGAVCETALWSMGPAETAQTLTALTRLVASLTELELRVAEHASGVGVENASGATSTASWWAHATNQTRAGAHRKIRLALALERYPRVRGALTRGEMLPDQAEVIVAALEELSCDLEVGVLHQAEAELVRQARHHDATALRILGRRILDVLDPAAGEAAEARKLEEEERQARARARFTMSEDGHGKCHGRFTIPTAQGAMLKKMLTAIAAPKHRAAIDGGLGERLPAPERMDLATLLGAERAATLDTGEKITASQARRMACEAGIIPAVLGGKSQVLDLGRKTRFHTTSQRIAMGLEQGGCTAQGCDWPPGMCHAHHQIPWSRGGDTSVKNGRLLCPRHHTRAHDPTYTMTKLPGGKVAFTTRT